jgi:hypothetical protein
MYIRVRDTKPGKWTVMCIRVSDIKPGKWTVMYIRVRDIKPGKWTVMYIRVRDTKPGKWTVMYIRVRDIEFAIQNTKGWATRTPLKTGEELIYPGWVNRSWSISVARVTFVITRW